MRKIIPPGLFRMTDDEWARFQSCFVQAGEDECWEWTGPIMPRGGRGTFCLRGYSTTAPRIMLAKATGILPTSDIFACHSCDNPKCVNPAHLWWGNNAENTRDAAKKGRMPMQRNPQASSLRKLSDHQILEIKRLLSSGASKSGLAEKFGVHERTIVRVASGERPIPEVGGTHA